VLFERKDYFPILLHIDHCPSIYRSSVQRYIETAEVRLFVVSIFALGIGVMNDRTEAYAAADGCPLQHLEIAVGISERGNRVTANAFVDSNRFARLVIDKIDVW